MPQVRASSSFCPASRARPVNQAKQKKRRTAPNRAYLPPIDGAVDGNPHPTTALVPLSGEVEPPESPLVLVELDLECLQQSHRVKVESLFIFINSIWCSSFAIRFSS